MRPFRTCREITALVLQGQDRALSRWERASMRVHWWICDSCRHFRGQAAVMQQAMARWRAYREEAEPGLDDTAASDPPAR